jgi:hypothetical protein
VHRILFSAALPLTIAACAAADAQSAGTGLTGFKSEAELRAFVDKIGKAHAARHRVHALNTYDVAEAPPALAMAAPAPAAEMAAPAAPGITNNQVPNVDEGGIVKAAGDYLVVLRRGRLFTVSVADGGLRPVSAIAAYPRGADASGDWYDEMLIAGDWVIVIGYSYSRGGTQLTRFRLGRDGGLSYVDAYAFTSADYYSSRNYASRLIGERLILYAPLPLDFSGQAEPAGPGFGQWDEQRRQMGKFRPLSVAARTFVPDRLKGDLTRIDTAHSVTDCAITAPVLRCKGTVVLGSSSRSFFVSQDAVFVWTSADNYDRPRPSAAPLMVYRLPLSGARPQAVAARGQPIDQFSFHPDDKRGALQVVVSRDGGGDAMFRSDSGQQRVYLATIPFRSFGSGWQTVPARNYQRLPGTTQSWNFQNRFVSDHLLYGEPSEGRGKVHVLSLASREVREVALPHDVERLDAIGRDAIVIGAGRAFLGFSAIALGEAEPRLAAEFRLPDAGQGESRSHAFFFRPDPADANGESGTLGLPVARQLRGGQGFLPSAAVLYLRREGRALASAGELAATPVMPMDDRCQASCVDWYGNARPIFLGDRVFALLGYELVEGRLGGPGVQEVGRTDFGALLSRRLAQR